MENKSVNLFVVFIMLASLVFAYNGLMQQSMIHLLSALYALVLGVLIILVLPSGKTKSSSKRSKSTKRKRK